MQALILCDELAPVEVARKCEALGCGIEIQSFYDPEYLNRTPNGIELHQEAVKDIKLRSLHGPFGDLCPGSFDVMVRDLARYRFAEAMDVARKLDATHLVLHHCYVAHTSPPSQYVERSSVFWKEFMATVPDSITVHMENYLELNAIMMSDLVDAVDPARLNVCLDVGHVYCRSQWTGIQWIEHLKDKIGYVHLHDNHGVDDEHLGLGQGTIPLVETLQALNEYAPKAIWALEVNLPDHDSSVAWLGEHGFMG